MNGDKNKQIAPQVVLAQHGNKEACKKLYAAYYKNIFFISKLMSCDSVAAMNLTEEIFIEMFKSVSKLSDYTAFEQWLYSIAVNMCKPDAANSQGETQSLVRDMSDIVSGIRRSVADNDKFAFERIIMNLLETVISALPFDAKAIFLYKNFALLDNDKIALIEKKDESDIAAGADAVDKFIFTIGEKLRGDGVDISPFAKDWNSTLCYLASRVFVPDSVHGKVSDFLGVDVNPFK
ncbi:MAG: sigma-70 family RNA polymerase sigma factor [Clostridia bacterium]|nr:sigma-70 family RNA polymerase sigma factor [Clostridia bacterium]